MDQIGWVIVGVFCIVGLHAALILVAIIIHLESKATQAQIELLKWQLRKAGMLND